MKKVFLIGSLFLTACASVPTPDVPKVVAYPPAPAPAPVVASVSAPYPLPPPRPEAVAMPQGATSIQTYRDVLYKDAKIPDNKLQGFVLFTHRPLNSSQEKLYSVVCDMWTKAFESKGDVLRVASAGTQVVPMYWLSQQDNSIANKTCRGNDLLNYDFAKAGLLASKIGKSATSAVGPLLVIQSNGRWFLLDISKFVPEDVDRAFMIWKNEISTKELDSKEFDLTLLKEQFRALIQTHGEEIIKVATNSK